MAVFEPILLQNVGKPDSQRIETYMRNGGYQALRKAVKEMTPAQVVDEVKKSNLRGRGGALFPTGLKWSSLPPGVYPRYLAVNADESEPGTFCNRYLIDNDPHMVIEGAIICAYACEIERGWIYIRGEFARGARILEQAIAEAYEKGFLGKNILGSDFSFELSVHRGAGAYICGEESALMESIEGKRAQPRVRPPFPTQVGLFGQPTVINNVETLACVPHIINRGGEWFASIGHPKCPGPKLFCVSGQIRRPGLYEGPIGMNLKELLFEHAGGPLPGRRIKAVIPGGASAAMLTGDEIDVGTDPDSITAAGSMLGTAGIIVIDDSTCIVQANLNISRFFQHESCGKCTPCREGTHWIWDIVRRIEYGQGRSYDLELLLDIADNIGGRKCLCPLGDFSLPALLSGLKKFRSEYEAHITGGGCPKRRVQVATA
jgi:NADH-quinone oxidoreductase subunit F